MDGRLSTTPKPVQPRRRADRAILTGLALLGVVLLGTLIYPFASALLFAAVLAGGLFPLFERLRRAVGDRPLIASTLLTLLVGALFAAPTLWLALTVGQEVLTGVGAVERTLRRGGGVPELIKMLPKAAQSKVRNAVQSVPGGSDKIEDMAEKRSDGAAAAVTAGLAVTTNIIIQFTLMLVAFFLLLLDGKAMVNWIAAVAPLPDEQVHEILEGFRAVSVAVMLSSLGTAGVQSLCALAGYLVAGVPQPMFFTFLTFVIAFIPAVGAASVVIAVAGLMFLNGHNEAALGLALWGMLVVSTVDNLVKPWLLGDRMQINTGLIFFALVGGIAAFGPIGLVAGPLILSFFLAVVRLAGKNPPAAAAERAT